MSDIVDILDPELNISLENEDSSLTKTNPDDEFDESQDQEQENHFQSLVRLQSSSNYNDRKNAVKFIQDALRSVNEIEQLHEILVLTKKLAEDVVSQVQIETFDKFVSIVDYLVENVVDFDVLIVDYLFPSIVETIGHGNSRIRKSSQTCLLRLFELNLVSSDQIESKIVPSLCNLERACDDFKTESILLMTRLSQFVSVDTVSNHFIPTIIEQSSSVAFQTRKTCATSLAELVNVLPSSLVDRDIVPCLSNLCSDPFWGVRKSCAEVLHPISQRCSDESRWNILSTCLIQLLQDQSRWVKTAALRVLGYFISTFSVQGTNDNEKQIDTNEKFNDFSYWKEFSYLNVSIDDDPVRCVETNLYRLSRSYSEDDVRRILPMELLDFYRNLIEQSYSSGVETDIVHQGAFTFPAVAITLGQKHWHLIRDLHKKFAEDLQWKVRRTLAFSLHCLAKILSDDQIEEDLCPIFDSFVRDVDEVKIGILSNLSKFLECLSQTSREKYLDRLIVLTTVDNQRNWRFRLETANQLTDLTSLFNCSDLFKSLTPLIFSLSNDRVSDVRLSSVKALSLSFLKYKQEKEDEFANEFIEQSRQSFSRSSNWKLRQLFVSLVESIFELRCQSTDDFVSMFVDDLVRLSDDPVVNVRLSVAKFIVEHLIVDESFVDLSLSRRSSVDSTIDKLNEDRDRDVRQIVGLCRPVSRVDLGLCQGSSTNNS